MLNEISQVQPDRRGADDNKEILSTLDIADRIHDSSTVRERCRCCREYEINIYPLSEIIPDKSSKTWAR